ncbi:LacI family DNA-binding transcriptional regulator [Actinoplanes sp. NPDC048796]|uniref:LacI family DNA-binding transcriptional regulator n=2 Tax=unclassified Actinoplanes TaxID=2626549 RepID=UPI0033E06518
MSRRPVMSDVAARAGVSHQTVSRVLNGHPHVSPTTRTRVLAAIAELGYRRNLSARVLATGRSNVVGVVAQNTTLYGPSSMVQAIGEAALGADLSLTVGHVAGYDATAASRRIVERLVQQGAAGLVFIAPVDAAAEAMRLVPPGIPIVTVDGLPEWDVANVSVDQYAGGRLATQHLLKHGHRTVWHVAGPEQWHGSRARESGWRAALAEAGAQAPPMLRAGWSAASGYQCGRMLARIPDCTAVFAANDHVALGVMRALAEQGRRVPEDVSLIGFDDVPEAAYFHPALTTIRQEFADVGRQALRLLLDQLVTGARTATSTLVEPAMVDRDTVAGPPVRGGS